ncbi:hypothetical protein BDW74DRAFT_183786 [Aspergillus multicolor]|uniref:uncharacterized protein n=1 Tax=Aspergillus multicolor TaxID=41759 RepID=UPI003CCDFE39
MHSSWLAHEEDLLLQLRRSSPDLTWYELAQLYNSYLPLHRRRTADAVKAKIKRCEKPTPTMSNETDSVAGLGGQHVFRFEEMSKTYLQLILRNTRSENQQLRQNVAASNQQLYWERLQHSNTYSQMQQAAVNHMQEVCELRSSLAQTQHELEVSKEAHDRMIAELQWARSKLYLIDELVDTMRLEEEGQKSINDRSMQITDMVLSLETKMENRYRQMLQGKDNEIAQLTREIRQLETSTNREREDYGFDLDTHAV